MSQWHRNNPDLCGTDADPSMGNEPYRLARDELLAEGLIYAAAQGASNTCEGCGGMVPVGADDAQMRRDAERLGIEIGPLLCDPCFERAGEDTAHA
jgi:hypothetical protein